MSNTAVGQIYTKIVTQVLEASQHDFAEEGVESAMLEMLKERWQARLSANRVAQFPWDPAPPTPAANPPAANPISSGPETSHYKPAIKTPSSSAATPVANGGNARPQNPSPVMTPSNPLPTNPAIKQENNYDTKPPFVPQLPQNNGYPNSTGHNPQQRAQALLQQKFGSQAGGSIAAMQAAGMGMQGQLPQTIQLPQGQRLAEPGQSQQPQHSQQNPRNAVKLAQTDGAGDVHEHWEDILEFRRAQADDGPSGRIAIDGFIHSQVNDMALRLEGGGMLETMEERERRFGKRRRVTQASRQSASASVQYPSNGNLAGPSRFDGGDSEDDEDLEDEDAINSDLDDPADANEGDEEIDTEMGDYILCTYDKVQRVKNKWKCTLKDGVLHADGKDYVFHKAQGEFEW